MKTNLPDRTGHRSPRAAPEIIDYVRAVLGRRDELLTLHELQVMVAIDRGTLARWARVGTPPWGRFLFAGLLFAKGKARQASHLLDGGNQGDMFS